jgi:hypothetical protein
MQLKQRQGGAFIISLPKVAVHFCGDFCRTTVRKPDTATFIFPLWPADSFHLAPLCRSDVPASLGDWRINVTDIIVVVLSTGGILLMAAYAALCDKI